SSYIRLSLVELSRIFLRMPRRNICFSSGALLHNVCKLVCNKRITYGCSGPVLTRPERYIATNRECPRVEAIGQSSSLCVSMYSNMRKVLPERRTHPRADTSIEILSTAQL